MWYGDRVRNRTQSEVFESAYESPRQAVVDVLQSVKCYDMMRESGKVVVFENKIPFQLAFYALIEHEIQVAPIWDPEFKQFVGMMTIRDFVNATRAYKAHNLPAHNFSAKTLQEMLTDSVYRISFCEFQSIDAEDTIFQACSMLRRLECDYLPVLDPDEGNLLATMGYFDILILIVETARTYPHLFAAHISSYMRQEGREVVTTTRETPIDEVLELLAQREISAAPVVDENGKVVGLYHRDDVTYLVKAADQGATIGNLALTVGDVLSAPVEHKSMNVLCTYKQTDTLLQVLHKCAESRSSRLVCVDDEDRCLGIVSVKDLVGMFVQS